MSRAKVNRPSGDGMQHCFERTISAARCSSRRNANTQLNVSGRSTCRIMARCTVERLIRKLWAARCDARKAVRISVSDAKAPCPLDRVNRQFRAEQPNQLWVFFTYVSTWRGRQSFRHRDLALPTGGVKVFALRRSESQPFGVAAPFPQLQKLAPALTQDQVVRPEPWHL